MITSSMRRAADAVAQDVDGPENGQAVDFFQLGVVVDESRPPRSPSSGERWTVWRIILPTRPAPTMSRRARPYAAHAEDGGDAAVDHAPDADQDDGQDPGIDDHEARIVEVLEDERGGRGGHDGADGDGDKDGVDLVDPGDAALEEVELVEAEGDDQGGHLDDHHLQVAAQRQDLDRRRVLGAHAKVVGQDEGQGDHGGVHDRPGAVSWA